MRQGPTCEERLDLARLRPSGLGNFQLFSRRKDGLGSSIHTAQPSALCQVGPNQNPNEATGSKKIASLGCAVDAEQVALGIHNDGKVIDVYNNKPNPPRQPGQLLELSGAGSCTWLLCQLSSSSRPLPLS